MGCSNSKESRGLQDVGFDWWNLVNLRKWNEVEKLVDTVSSTCDHLNNRGESLLHTLAGFDLVPRPLFKKVVEKSYSQYHRREAGKVPLHKALDIFNKENIIDLLEHDKDAVLMTCDESDSVLEYAVLHYTYKLNGYPEVFAMLLDAVLTGKNPEKGEEGKLFQNPVTTEDHILKVFRILCTRAYQTDKLIDVMIQRDSRLAMQPGCFLVALSKTNIRNLYNIFQSFFRRIKLS